MDFSHQQGHNYVRRVSTAVLAEAPLPHMAAVHHFGGGAQFEVQAGSWGIEVAGARGIGVGRVGIGETGAVWAEGIEAVWADTEGAGGGTGAGGAGAGRPGVAAQPVPPPPSHSHWASAPVPAALVPPVPPSGTQAAPALLVVPQPNSVYRGCWVGWERSLVGGASALQAGPPALQQCPGGCSRCRGRGEPFAEPGRLV